MKLDPSLAENALRPLADATNKSIIELALGIIRIAEANMAHAVRGGRAGAATTRDISH